MLDKTYSPKEIEERIYAGWDEAGAFKAGQRPDAAPFCIVIPPPNVTGTLHMGHALNNTIQDILVRYQRMRGKDVLWQTGMDHAGIATQMVVERQLAEQGQPSRREMGREAFIERVWQWKDESGGMILSTLRRLGASCDWTRERFTMDEGLSKAVTKVFVDLYKAGLIYKDKRLVNWDPKLLTAISDLEVMPVEIKGKLWHFNYPVKDEPGRFITIATTRPETMLGDTGIAVHPDDERYRDLVGKSALLPLVGRELPIVADEYADPEQGSGAVKITPAHDFNDFEVGRRHGLAVINIFDQYARIRNWEQQAPGSVEDALRRSPSFHVQDMDDSEVVALKAIPDELRGLDRFEARARIVERMEEEGLVVLVEDHEHTVPYGDRSNVAIEPYLTDQWYVDAKTLAGPAIAAVEGGETAFIPKNWEKTYFDWMHNIQPWCISRQLWWGHRIPAWYGPDGAVFVEETEEAANEAARRHYGSEVSLVRDEDVLDTWFSSALWPFSTLGWPDETPELARFYKTDVLVTGFDIIFFWVARMMMMGLHFMKEVPFHTVYIHALVRDEKGQKMSKSKGNVIDPQELIDEYGADALRFSLAAMAAQGRDIKLSRQRVEGYRNFATKLWNAARFCEMNECRLQAGFDPHGARHSVNRWIAGEAVRAAVSVREGIEQFRFNEAANAAYRFVWNIYCDWYLELIKPILAGDDEDAKAETRAMAAWTLDQILLVLHPMMPFITEELWQRTGEATGERETLLILAPWPDHKQLGDAAADAEMEWVVRLVSEIRSVRAEMNVPAGARIACVLVGGEERARRVVADWKTEISRLARLETLVIADEAPEGAIQIVMDEAVVALPLGGIIDLSAERKRLEKELNKIETEVSKLADKLANEKFVANAPDHVVEEQRERKAEAEERRTRLADALARLAGAA